MQTTLLTPAQSAHAALLRRAQAARRDYAITRQAEHLGATKAFEEAARLLAEHLPHNLDSVERAEVAS